MHGAQVLFTRVCVCVRVCVCACVRARARACVCVFVRARVRARACCNTSCSRVCAVQINAGTEMLEGEEFGDDNFDFEDEDENIQ